jgi:hypothetical protein
VLRLHSRVHLLLAEEEKANKVILDTKQKVKSLIKGKTKSNEPADFIVPTRQDDPKPVKRHTSVRVSYQQERNELQDKLKEMHAQKTQ